MRTDNIKYNCKGIIKKHITQLDFNDDDDGNECKSKIHLK